MQQVRIMSSPVIEPSEIITGRDEGAHIRMHEASAWIRFIARFFDYSLFFTLLHIVSNPISLPGLNRIIPLEFLAWVPIETLLLMTWGATPGKWLLCIEVKKGFASRLSFRCALRRSFSVYLRGLGMGIVVINILCMIHSFYRLRIVQSTTWDRDEGTSVIQHSLSKRRYYFSTIVVIAGMIIYSFWKKSWL
jgi:uncharacterized RDD family membrane protein YckC